jgi:hypothetical protein
MLTKKTLQLVAIVFLSFWVVSCDKEYNSIGSNLIGANHFAFGEPDVDASIISYNEDLGVVQTNNLLINPLGIYKDPTFGTQTAHFVTQLLLPDPVPTFTTITEEPEIEEVLLYIPYFSRAIGIEEGTTFYELDSIYGNSKIKLSIYENGLFLRDVDPASNFTNPQKYFSDQVTDFEMNKRGAAADGASIPNGERLNNGVDVDNSEQFIFDSRQITETVEDEDGEATINRSAPGMYLKLNKDFFQKKIIDAAALGNLANNNVFKEYFRGLYFKVEASANEPNGSSLAMMNFRGGNITIKYKEDKAGTGADLAIITRVDKTIVLSLTGNTVSLVSQERKPQYSAALASASPTFGDERLYLKGGSGSIAVLDLFGRDANGESAELEEYRSKNWLINEANLTFYIDKEKMAEAAEPNRIYLYDLTNNRPIFDYFFDQTTNSLKPKLGKRIHSGIIVKEDDKGKLYKIRLTNHITQLLKNADSTNVRLGLVVTEAIGITENYAIKNETASGLKKVPIASVLNPLGTVLYGSKTSVPLPKRLKLEIYYTKPD